MRSRLKLGTLLHVVVVLVVIAAGTADQNAKCANSDDGYKLPCNKNIDPWKAMKKKVDDLAADAKAESETLWSRISDSQETISVIVEVTEPVAEKIKSVREKAKDSAVSTVKSPTAVAVKAKGATKWLQKGAKVIGAIASAVQFLGPIMDIVLLFAPTTKSDELKAIESGFAGMGAKIDAVSSQLENIKGALEWNAVVGKLIEIEATVDQTTAKYDHLVNDIKAIQPGSQGLPISVKGHIEDLVQAITGAGNIPNSLQFIDNLFKGKSAFTQKRKLLEMYVAAVDNDCTQILPMSSKLIGIVKNAQRLQYFYETNKRLIESADDVKGQGYPKIIYDMYKESITQYIKCTKNAASDAQKKMSIQYGNAEKLEKIIDEFERKYDLYSWSTMKESNKEEEYFALVDNSARKLDVELTALSEDDKEEQRLTLFAIKKSSKTEVDDAIARVQKVLMSLKKTEIPRFESGKKWSYNQKFRDETLQKVRDLLKNKDATLKSLIDGRRMTMVMFEKESKIDLTGWHYKSNMQVSKVNTKHSGGKVGTTSTYLTYHQFTLGFSFNFPKDMSDFSCSSNGVRIDMSFDDSFPYCVCDMNYGGSSCSISLSKNPPSTALSNTVLNLVKMYKVPGMFDLQDDIKKGTDKIMHELENTKQEIFTMVRQTGSEAEKSKNAILSAQSIMLNDLKADNARLLRDFSGLRAAMEAAFERERNERIYRSEKGQKVVIKTIDEANKKVINSINRLSGKVVQNRYFVQLKLNIPVFQKKFKKAIEYGGVAENDFSQYLQIHEQDFLVAKESAKRAIVEKADSFVMAQMQISMVSGCTDKYTELIRLTWQEMMELHLSMTTMEQWDLDHKIKTSTSQVNIDLFNHERDALVKEALSDTNEFKKVIKSRSCPAFSMTGLLGGGCDASITYPGQSVPMQCSGPNKSLVLASTGGVISVVVCQSDSVWAVDVEDLRCVSKCVFEGQYYEIGGTRRLPDAPNGYYWADKDGNDIRESTCLVMSGLRASWSTTTKTDVDECVISGFCGFGGICTNTAGSFTCTCPSGFSVGSDEKCQDVNECNSGMVGYNKCLVQSTLGACENTDGSYRCTCFTGAYTNSNQAGKECIACNCNQNGATSSVCDGQTGVCLCNTNVGGADCGSCKTGYTTFPYCTQCSAGYYRYPDCVQCNCMDSGVTAQYCNAYTSQCTCKDNVAGSRCEHCEKHYKSFPACVKDVKDGTLSAWGPWSDWKDQGKCGPSYMIGYTQKRTRKRNCNDSTKNIHGRSCAGDSLEGFATRFHEVCKSVTGVYITLPINYHAGTSAHLWMGIRQGTIECKTVEPTWDGPQEGDKKPVTYWRSGQRGCARTFDNTKKIDLYLYSNDGNDVYVTNMGAMIGATYKTWYTGGSYTAIDEEKNNGWYTTTD